MVMLQESVFAFYFLARSPNSPRYFSSETDVLLEEMYASHWLALCLHLFAPVDRGAHRALSPTLEPTKVRPEQQQSSPVLAD